MSSSGSKDSMPGAGDQDARPDRARRGPARTRRRPTPGRPRRPRRASTVRPRPSQLGRPRPRPRRRCGRGSADPVAVGQRTAARHAEPDARGAAGDDRDPAHRAASAGSNSRCSLVRPAEDPGRLVAEVAVTGRAVVLLGQADVAHPVEDALEAHPALGPGQRAAGAGVDAAPEGDVGLGVGPIDVELGRALEAPRVAVGRAVEQHHRGAGRDVDAADGRGCAG